MKIKKIYMLVLCAMMIFGFASCAESEQTFTENNYVPPEKESTVSNVPEKISEGIYAIYNEEKNAYLSFEERKLKLSENPQNWEIKASGEKGFYIYAENTELLFDIDNAFVYEGTEIKIWELTGYETQIWNISENEDSTFSFLCSTDISFCLGFGEGAELQKKDENNSLQKWNLIRTGNIAKNYYSEISSGGIIELQLPSDITDVISEERIAEWADNLEKAYYTFYELTGNKPYESIIVEAYKPCQYTGYVYPNSNVIHIDGDFIRGDLAKMALRESDWNFCALHEMGHMFDFGMPWNFEAEVMTDLKVAYVLEANGVSAVPSEFDASYNFYGKDIMNAYSILGSDFSAKYDVYACARRFLEIKEKTGWEPFKKAFHYLEENKHQYYALSGGEKFENFIDLLSLYSGTYIRNEFSPEEWETVISASDK